MTFGELALSIAEGAEAETGKALQIVRFSEAEKAEMTEYLKQELRAGDAVLFKGSNSMKLFETAAHFTAEGRNV